MDLKMMSAVELAFVGDAVYELLVRERVTKSVNTTPSRLHSMTVQYVCAASQHAALHAISDCLTEQEQMIVRRGKNSNKTTVPRHSSPELYRSATAIEALFGFLFLSGQNERIEELFHIICEDFDRMAADASGD